MKATPSDIKKALREIVGANPNLPITGIVKSVEGDSCTVELKSGYVATDVKLKATIGNNDYVILTPKVGSTVLILSLSGTLDNLTVVKIDQLEKMEYSQGGLVILADSVDGKIQIKNKQVSFIELFEALKKLTAELTVSTPMGPSGVPLPPTQLALQQFEIKFKQLLK
ncbi:MAG: hypothetical protein JJE55_08285 [Flavobacteriaceae bacterium]|nr:hypothetical protein [Flavobacteriaceae bacterium]